MAVLSKGKTFGATEEVTNAKLHQLVDDGSVTGITNADIAPDAAIDGSKINIDTTGNVLITGTQTITGAKTFTATTAMAGVSSTGLTVNGDMTVTGTLTIPDISLTTGVTGTLPIANGGTGTTASANSANGVVIPTGAVNSANGAVILNGSSQLPAVSGALLTGLPSPGSVVLVSTTNIVNDTTSGSIAITASKRYMIVLEGESSPPGSWTHSYGGGNETVLSASSGNILSVYYLSSANVGTATIIAGSTCAGGFAGVGYRCSVVATSFKIKTSGSANATIKLYEILS